MGLCSSARSTTNRDFLHMVTIASCYHCKIKLRTPPEGALGTRLLSCISLSLMESPHQNGALLWTNARCTSRISVYSRPFPKLRMTSQHCSIGIPRSIPDIVIQELADMDPAEELKRANSDRSMCEVVIELLEACKLKLDTETEKAVKQYVRTEFSPYFFEFLG